MQRYGKFSKLMYFFFQPNAVVFKKSVYLQLKKGEQLNKLHNKKVSFELV